jgi:hypothetical protein
MKKVQQTTFSALDFAHSKTTSRLHLASAVIKMRQNWFQNLPNALFSTLNDTQ